MKNYDWIQGFLLEKSEIFDFENDKKVQGVSFEILQFQMAVVQKLCIFDPMLVKPKCV